VSVASSSGVSVTHTQARILTHSLSRARALSLLSFSLPLVLARSGFNSLTSLTSPPPSRLAPLPPLPLPPLLTISPSSLSLRLSRSLLLYLSSSLSPHSHAHTHTGVNNKTLASRCRRNVGQRSTRLFAFSRTSSSSFLLCIVHHQLVRHQTNLGPRPAPCRVAQRQGRVATG
jgi:hypothetical protein